MTKRFVRPTDVQGGLSTLEHEQHEEITKEITNMVVSVMQNGKYSNRMAAETLLRSLSHSRTNASIVEDTIFYKVCFWLSNSKAKLSNFTNPGKLSKAIANDMLCNVTAVRSALALHPFDLPEKLKPKRTSSNKSKGSSLGKDVTPSPPEPEKIYVPVLKDLFKVYQFSVIVKAIADKDLVDQFNDIFKEEIALIESKLKS